MTLNYSQSVEYDEILSWVRIWTEPNDSMSNAAASSMIIRIRGIPGDF